MNLVRYILVHKKIKKQFWAEVLATAFYVRNHVTSTVLQPNTTPHHKWMGKAPNLGHIRVFGSKCRYTLPKKTVKSCNPELEKRCFLDMQRAVRHTSFWMVNCENF